MKPLPRVAQEDVVVRDTGAARGTGDSACPQIIVAIVAEPGAGTHVPARVRVVAVVLIEAFVATRALQPLKNIVRRHQKQSARVAQRQSVREVSEMWWCDCESGFAGFMLCCFMLWWCAPSVVVRAGYMRGWAPP